MRLAHSQSLIISTIAGGGAGDGNSALLANVVPASVALDARGNLYIADTSNNRIRKVAAVTGVITTVAGNGLGGFSGDSAAATSASLNSPSGVAVDASGNLYVAERLTDRDFVAFSLTRKF